MKKGLLLGAGFSFDFGMPLASEVSEILFKFYCPENEEALNNILSKQQPFSDDRPINADAIRAAIGLILKYRSEGEQNYEAVIGALERKEGARPTNHSDSDSFHFVAVKVYELIYIILTAYQEQAYAICYNRVKDWFKNIDGLFSENETWIFSLNHDLFLECLAKDFGIPFTYGDTSSIEFPLNNLHLRDRVRFGAYKRDEISLSNNNFFKGQKGINLVKLHGGLSELLYDDSKLFCNLTFDGSSAAEVMSQFQRFRKIGYYVRGHKMPLSKDLWLSDFDGKPDIAQLSMLTGENKYSKTSNTKDGEEKLKLFDDVLQTLNELTIIGYGFGDEHVNFRLSNAMLLNQNLKVTFVDPLHRSEPPPCIKQFNYNSRIRPVSSDVANWLAYNKTQKWDRNLMQAVKDNAQYRAIVKNQLLKEFSRKI